MVEILKRLQFFLVFRYIKGRAFVFAIPLLWILLFFVIPFGIVLKISFSESIYGAPPYAAMIEWVNDVTMAIRLNFSSYLFLFQDNLYVMSYISSLGLAGFATLLCLLIGYPMAYGISQAPLKWRLPLLLMVILPFWTSFLIRIYAWLGILGHTGLLNSILLYLRIIDHPLPLLNNNFSVCVGLVYAYLPFMILPLYTIFEKMDPSLLEAAADLGARPFRTFLKVTLPLSVPGIIIGSMLVFIPAVGEFVIPELLGGSDNLMIGKVLWTEFFNNRDWPVASAIAISLLILLVLPMIIFQRLKMHKG
jgi:putrescine transport system permease protein